MNRQALTEALAWWDAQGADLEPEEQAILAAARLVERLLPGECESCRVCVHGRYEMHTATDWACAGPFTELRPRSICPDCHGSGQVWDEGIVEAMGRVPMLEFDGTHYTPSTVGHAVSPKERIAILEAVLSALAEAGGVS